jgi:hypothetical protein
MTSDPVVAISELDWHTFDQFSWLGDLGSFLDGDSNPSPTLAMLSSCTAFTGSKLRNRPDHLLHVYVALGLSEASRGLIHSKTLDDFYKRFFHTSVSSPFMRLFFNENVTVMIVRRRYNKRDAFRLDIVGAITFSRPRDKMATYLAYMAVSDGRGRMPSLAEGAPVQVVPKNSLPGNEPHIGFQGLGLGGFMIRVMEQLVRSSITLACIPLPECYLHFNNNNSKSEDGWLKLGFQPVFDDALPADESVPLAQGYNGLAEAFAGCSIFNASHDSEDSITMFTKFVFPSVEPPDGSDDELARANEVPDWFKYHEPDMEDKFIANFPSDPFYILDEAEVVAKYTEPDADRPHPLRCPDILDMAWARTQFCSGLKNSTEGRADQELGADPDTDSSIKSSSSSDSTSSSSSSSSSESQDDTSGHRKKKSRKKKRKKKERKRKAKKHAKSKKRKKARATNLPTQRSRFDTKFSDQEFIDFACLQDPNRSIRVDPGSLVQIGREKLLTVFVDSYDLPRGVSLNSARTDKVFLTRDDNRSIRCSWDWLRREVVPEVASLLEEKIFGIPIVEGIGLDHVDSDVARRDIRTIAALHGTYSRASGFLSPPVSHVRTKLPVDDFGEKEYGRKASHAEALEEMRLHRKNTSEFAKLVKTLKIKDDPPPLPRSRYQISRLKWIPTEEEGADKFKIGYFQGAYKVPDTSHFSVVSLRREWVDYQFEETFIQDVKDQAVGGTRSSRKLVEIPPGDSKPDDQQPPPYLMLYMRPAKFQQKENSTCLVDAFSSAMEAFGCHDPVVELRKQEEKAALSAANKNIWGDFANLVNRHFKPVGLQLFKQKGVITLEQMLHCDDSFVIVASLKANDGSEGQHAVAFFNGAIYDANSRFALQKSQESLDWCCGSIDGVFCTGFAKVYKLLPVNHRNVPEESRFVFQKRKQNGCLVRGWIVSYRTVSTLLQFADGEKREATQYELSKFKRLRPACP